MITHNHEQYSEAWWNCRRGLPTASHFDEIITTTGESSKQRTKYMYQLVGEKLSGLSEETYQNFAMQRGLELEKEAINFYEMVKDKKVDLVGFCTTDDGTAGCSPDGCIEEDGLIEVKCPLMAGHISYLLENKLPTIYYQQTQGQLYVTGRKWCDFISYYPAIRPLIIRVNRDESFIKKLEIELNKFSKELEEIYNKLK